jgi:hypothetical protein
MNRIVLSFAVVLVLASAGYATASSLPSSDTTAETARSADAASAHFSVLRGPPASASVADRARAERLANQMPAEFRINPARTVIARDTTDYTIALLQGEGTLCLVRSEAAGGGGAGCTDTPSFNANGVHPMASVDVVQRGWRVSSLMPDGTRDIVLTSHDGSRQTLQLVNNVVTSIVDSAPDALSWASPDGSRQELKFTDPAL